MTKVKVKAAEPAFTVTLKVNNKVCEATGATLIEALSKLEKPAIIKTTGLITITSGDKSTKRILNIPKLKSLFGKEVYRVILAKNLGLFLK